MHLPAELKPFALLLSLLAATCNQSSGATPARGDEAERTAALSAGATLPASLSHQRLHGLEDGVLRVWPIGDSITEGVEGGYRNRLYKLLRERDINVDYVGTLYDESTKVSDRHHEGHPGFTISNAHQNVDQWLETVPRPDVVLMMLGTNDFAWWTNVSVEEHHGYFVKLVDHLLARLPGALLVVSTIPPQSSKLIEDVKLDRHEMSAEFNELLRRSVPAHPSYGKRLFLADAARELGLSDLSDGIHPTKRGHDKIARVYFATLAQAIAR